MNYANIIIRLLYVIQGLTGLFTGGLGGTLMDGSERGLGYEGIDLSDEIVCKRKPTLQKLQQALSDKGVILVHAPLMAGKTSLAQLFEHHLLELSEFQSRSFGCHCCG